MRPKKRADLKVRNGALVLPPHRLRRPAPSLQRRAVLARGAASWGRRRGHLSDAVLCRPASSRPLSAQPQGRTALKHGRSSSSLLGPPNPVLGGSPGVGGNSQASPTRCAACRQPASPRVLCAHRRAWLLSPDRRGRGRVCPPLQWPASCVGAEHTKNARPLVPKTGWGSANEHGIIQSFLCSAFQLFIAFYIDSLQYSEFE